jgi:ribosomal protein S18 acetylase RimI-like enzyme
MASLTKSLEQTSKKAGLRPFDSRTDLGQVADLVELCFADTLDRSGRDYLARLRASANRGVLFSNTGSLPGSTMTGFIWEENNRIIGNVSLIPFIMKSRRSYLIANVAVHPDWRRRGIGRQMTEAAVDFVRRRGLPSVWLHVRIENQAAVELYRSLGFVQKTARTTWVAEPAPQSGEDPPGLRFHSPTRVQWDLLKSWYNRTYPAEFSWHLPFHLTNLRPGLLGAVSRMLFNTYVLQWSVAHLGEVCAAAAWQAVEANTNLLWLAAPQNTEPFFIRSLLEFALQHVPTRRTITLEYPAYQFEQPIREAGFVDQQTLAWMELPLLDVER